ncbi:uncharacterized protein BX664DRAFT_279802, partial [Halteromyces radiatus]|uniref:uncharacterized protein n=1 Tax=Halteromyces radiatus TaxID=101107 RepID=UPI0022211F90
PAVHSLFFLDAPPVHSLFLSLTPFLDYHYYLPCLTFVFCIIYDGHPSFIR